jgi:hypothetical protein
VWTKTADEILDKITRYLQPISNSDTRASGLNCSAGGVADSQ